MRTRILFAFLLAVAAVLVSATPALSDNGDNPAPSVAPASSVPATELPDPSTTNIPYLAWRGEQIRFVKCYMAEDFDSRAVETPSTFFSYYKAQLAVVDWSGNANFKPTLEENTVQAFALGRELCVRGDLTSQYPGVAQIKLVVTDLNGSIVAPKHDFLAIWMTLTTPTLTELPLGGDAATLNVFNPLVTPKGNVAPEDGYMSVRVTGTFPGFDGATWTLPTMWPQLAAALAVDGSSDSNPGPLQGAAPPMRWDTHDNLSWDPLQLGDVHVPGFCAGVGATDAVDNCRGGWAFSRVFGDYTVSPVGPFDPMRATETLLSDGILDAGDAPMPAARIDVKLTGAAGSLATADKTIVYSRDHTGNYLVKHNVNAPYYMQWIPATAAGFWASGIDGPARGNNFPGFLVDGIYHLWDVIPQHERGPANRCNDALGNPLGLTGYDHVVVYTDEHGEAIVGFHPYAGFRLAPDGNNRCYEITRPTAFTGTVQAEAKYPYEPVIGSGPFLSTTLTKTVNTLSTKVLSCVPKGTNEAFCVERILDFLGNPVAGAPVKFTATSPSTPHVDADSVSYGGFDTRGQTVVADDDYDQFVLLRTNSLGQAGVLVTLSNPECVNIDAENSGTKWTASQPGIKVFTAFNPALGTTCSMGTGGTTTTTTTTTTSTSSSTTTTTTAAPSGGGGGGGGGSTTDVSPAATVVTLPGAIQPTVVVPAASKTVTATRKSTLSIARLINTKAGRYLSVKVASPNKTAQIKVTLLAKNGKIAKIATRSVAANKLVRVPNLAIGKAVLKVRVAVLR